MTKISLDLSDIGIAHTVPVEVQVKHKDVEPTISDYGMPVSVSLMVQVAHCLGCGAEHREHQGVCLEIEYKSHKVFRKMERWEGQLYRTLPRRIEFQTPIAIDYCATCFVYDQIIESIFETPQKELVFEEARRIAGGPIIDVADLESEVDSQDGDGTADSDGEEDPSLGEALVGRRDRTRDGEGEERDAILHDHRDL
jgi:hypothetical protein